jgi:hypothetical protein
VNVPENDLLRILADVDESSRSDEPGSKLAHVDVARFVHLRGAEEGDIQTAPVVEIELVWLIDEGVDVRAGSEIEAAVGHPADDARLRRQGKQIQHSFFVRNAGDPLGHPDAEVHHLVGPKLEGGTPRDHFPRSRIHRRNRGHGDADLTRKSGIV